MTLEPRQGSVPDPDVEAVERGAMALTQFVFPGLVIPRREMAEAVLRSALHGEDPRVGVVKTVVPTYRESPCCDRCGGGHYTHEHDA